MKKKNQINVYLDSFGISAYQLTWNGAYCVGFFAHLPDEDCVVKCGLCSVCVTSPANPLPLFYSCCPNLY